MFRNLQICILAFLLFGCGGGANTDNPSSNPQPKSSAETSTAAKKPAKPFSAPKTIEEFKALFTTAFDTGDTATIEKMVYSQGAPKRLFELTLTVEIGIRSAGKEKVISIKHQPIESDPRREDLSLYCDYVIKPTFIVDFETEGESSGSSASIPVGESDGALYFLVCIDKGLNQTKAE